jgi:hypothetical protein
MKTQKNNTFNLYSLSIEELSQQIPYLDHPLRVQDKKILLILPNIYIHDQICLKITMVQEIEFILTTFL